MNPCPCGYYTHPQRACFCHTTKIQNYMNKISGPLLDRIDIHMEIPAVKYKELSDINAAESSRVIKERVEKARTIADLSGTEIILAEHISEAIQYRSIDRQNF